MYCDGQVFYGSDANTYYVYWAALSVKIPTFVSELIKTECVVHITKFDELLFFAYYFFDMNTKVGPPKRTELCFSQQIFIFWISQFHRT